MKTGLTSSVIISLTCAVFSIPAATLYVNLNSTNPVSPYAGWSTAATNIQEAINVSHAGDLVWVTNGVYSGGGEELMGVSNRIVLDKAVTVQSVNGPFVTVIQGAWDPNSTNGPDAIRCAWLTNGAALYGFTLQNGATGTGGYVGGILGSIDSGGGVWCASTNAVVSNCILSNNSAIYGAGVCSGTVKNCLIVGNTTFQYGGGAFYSTLKNCTVAGNYCNFYNAMNGSGAGAFDCAAENSILVGNLSMELPEPVYSVIDN